MNPNIKKAKTIILSITLSLAFVFILSGSLMKVNFGGAGSGNSGINGWDYATSIYTNSVKTQYNMNYGDDIYFQYYSSNSGYHYLYLEGADLTSIEMSSGNNMAYTLYDTDYYYNGTYYDYVYMVYLNYSYEDYLIEVDAEYSTVKVLITY